MLTAYGGKIIKKLVQGVAFFEIIEQSLDRHASARENGRAAKNVIRAID